MKIEIFTAFLLFLNLEIYAQVNFEPGYFINNDNLRISCLIKNVDKKINPSSFSYKLNENSKIIKATIQDIKEFSVSDAKYIRSIVEIDRTSDKSNEIRAGSQPDFIRQKLFLKVLVEGKANLYLFENGNITRFFYSDSDSVIEPLIYKRYLRKSNYIGENNSFRQQLLTNVSCELNLSVKDLKYTKRDLVDYFKRYHECIGVEYKLIGYKEKKGKTSLLLKLGLNINNLTIETSDGSSIFDYKNDPGYQLGISLEYRFPFNKNKWSLLVEPTLNYYKCKKVVTQSPSFQRVNEINYLSIEVPLGIRNYIYFSNKFSLFLNSFVELDFPINSKFKSYLFAEEFLGNTLRIYTSFGLGFDYNSVINVELRYSTKRNLFNEFYIWEGKFRGFSLIVGYNILQ